VRLYSYLTIAFVTLEVFSANPAYSREIVVNEFNTAITTSAFFNPGNDEAASNPTELIAAVSTGFVFQNFGKHTTVWTDLTGKVMRAEKWASMPKSFNYNADSVIATTNSGLWVIEGADYSLFSLQGTFVKSQRDLPLSVGRRISDDVVEFDFDFVQPFPTGDFWQREGTVLIVVNGLDVTWYQLLPTNQAKNDKPISRPKRQGAHRIAPSIINVKETDDPVIGSERQVLREVQVPKLSTRMKVYYLTNEPPKLVLRQLEPD
jgi:hypothetical protein